MIKLVLTKAGYDVSIADNGAAGVEKANSIKPDLILMDVIMPELDGVETVTQIREIESLKDVPIIFLTSVTASENVIIPVKDQNYPAVSKMKDHNLILNKIHQLIGR